VLIASAWGISDNNRRARFYRLTRAGRKKLVAETASGSNSFGRGIQRTMVHQQKLVRCTLDGGRDPVAASGHS
jgi:hypothetical protein